MTKRLLLLSLLTLLPLGLKATGGSDAEGKMC